jgi:uncharacterized phage protein (TIGR02218 family)
VKSMSAGYKAHLALGSTRIARCFKAVLTDGTVVAATGHQRVLTIDAVRYLTSTGYISSDVESGSDLAPDNMEVEGIKLAPFITEDDVRSGRWDYAKVEFFKVVYTDLSLGRDDVRYGTLGEVRSGRLKVASELRGLFQKLSRKFIPVVTKECLHDLGDEFCQVDLAPLTVTGTVFSVTDDDLFNDPARTEATDWYAAGKILWLTGDNANRGMEVQQSTSSGTIKLVEKMAFPIAPGDTYSMYPGCLKRFTEDCVVKFSNGVNFLGCHMLPGQRIYKRGGVA